jgi:hypothetical protein
MNEIFRVLHVDQPLGCDAPSLDVVLEEDWVSGDSGKMELIYAIKAKLPIGGGLMIERELSIKDLAALARTCVGAMSLVAEANLLNTMVDNQSVQEAGHAFEPMTGSVEFPGESQEPPQACGGTANAVLRPLGVTPDVQV